MFVFCNDIHYVWRLDYLGDQVTANNLLDVGSAKTLNCILMMNQLAERQPEIDS